MSRFDVAIIGGGIIGCALARVLVGENLRVCIIDRGAPGSEASGAAAGMLSPSAEAEKDNPLFLLSRASRNLYQALADELVAETGIDPQYRTEGTLVLTADEHEHGQMMATVEWQRSLGVPVEQLSSQQLRELEPALSEPAAAFFFPQDHQVDNRLLMDALIQSCRQRGVEFVLGRTAVAVERNGHGAAGVDLSDGYIAVPKIINCSGAWAAAIRVPGLAPPPIRPVKGHMLALRSPTGVLRHVVRTARAYLVPRRDGRVLVGSTMEEAGFDKTPRAGPLAGLLQSAQLLCPALEQSEIAEYWAGLRPAAPDGLPLLGPTELEGYWFALGHFRNGILLAPITAAVLSEWFLTGHTPIPMESFSPNRFAT
jgi:glycine oxidase